MTTTTREQLQHVLEPLQPTTPQFKLKELEAIIDDACTEAREQGFYAGCGVGDVSIEKVPQAYQMYLDEMRKLQSGKDEVTHE
jgi:hypothetical protein